ncbi:Uncharacterised protein [BD1-7 clade bacterium]|uniref:Polysaccharide biosynthesis protein C-terminal domain-containing protein n=1 Tax=BD1-7 clade bacterium TaxID=2029982 RepID=A0A5S9QX76_9GAMM|nr:Uncharacterised protein [BD1-7 clade bacterium]
MVASAASYFLASIFSKKYMSEEDFYYWNVFVTLMSVSYSFCFLGAEQLFLRFGHREGNQYSLSKDTVRVLLISNAIYCVLITLITYFFVFEIEEYWYTASLTLMAGVFVFTYNYFRILGKFFLSQLSNNMWKLILLIALVFLHEYGALVSSFVALSASTVFCLVLLYYHRSLLVVLSEKQPGDWIKLWFGFGLSLLCLMLLNNLDRFLVETTVSKSSFSSYTYLYTLLILPFSIVSSYVGFKEIVRLKKEYSRRKFYSKTLIIVLLVALLFSAWYLALYFASPFLELELEGAYFIPCLILVCVKCGYSMFSSLFGLKASASQMLRANISTLIAMSSAFIMPFYFQVTFVNVICLFAGFWILRLIAFWHAVQRIEEYSSSQAVFKAG